MIFQAIAFYILSGMLLFAGLCVVFARNPVHSVLFLIMAFFNGAGLFLLLGAEYLAMILLVVYVGAVLVLFLFVVMMLDVNFRALRQTAWGYVSVGLLIGAALAAELVMVVLAWSMAPEVRGTAGGPTPAPGGVSNIHALGRVLYTDYLYLFQAAGLILLVAMIGAIVLTLRKREGVRRQNIAAQVGRRREEGVELRKVKSGEGI